MKKININKDTLAKDISCLYDRIKNGVWSYFYDKELDSLYITPKEGIKGKFDLLSVNPEMYVYVDKNSNLGGVMISYFKSNLTNHDELFKQFKTVFTKKEDGGMTIPKSDKHNIKDLTQTIICELEKSVFQSSNCLA